MGTCATRVEPRTTGDDPENGVVPQTPLTQLREFDTDDEAYSPVKSASPMRIMRGNGPQGSSLLHRNGLNLTIEPVDPSPMSELSGALSEEEVCTSAVSTLSSSSSLSSVSTNHRLHRVKSRSLNLIKDWLADTLGNEAASRTFEDVYALDGAIGSGSTCKVYRCLLKSGDRKKNIFACKRIVKSKLVSMFSRDVPKAVERLKAEIACGMTMRHENIVRVLDVFESDKNIDVVMELVEGGELFDHIMNRDSLNERDAAQIVFQILRALEYIHEKGAIHRDLKPENVMVSDDSNGLRIKLVDFGLSSVLDPNALGTRSRVGTPGYMAPEIVGGSKDTSQQVVRTAYNSSVDMFSLGVLTFVLLTGFMPYTPEEHASAMSRKNMEPKFHADEWTGISTEAKAFVRRLLKYKPSARLTAKQGLKHPWMRRFGFCDTIEMPGRDSTSVISPQELQKISQAPKLRSPRRLKKAGLDRRKNNMFFADDGGTDPNRRSGDVGGGPAIDTYGVLIRGGHTYG